MMLRDPDSESWLRPALSANYARFLTAIYTAGCERAGTEAAPELRCAFEVAALRQEVWTAFVETEVPRSYYFDTVLQAELETGGRWRFVTEDRGRLPAFGEIVVLEPPAQLELTFAAADQRRVSNGRPAHPGRIW
jgi:uncharacterized protein YndB with AHSA1/START domain